MPVLLACLEHASCRLAGPLTDTMMFVSFAALLAQRTMWPRRCSGATTPGMQTWVASSCVTRVLQAPGVPESPCHSQAFVPHQPLASLQMWSLGVILYILLSGMPPFYGDTEARVL
jgi:serine/threonine protein kinase